MLLLSMLRAARGVFRCMTGNTHFISPSSDCEGQKVESVLGYLSTLRTTDTPRGLRRCRQTADPIHYYHALDAECDADSVDEGFYGYVH